MGSSDHFADMPEFASFSRGSPRLVEGPRPVSAIAETPVYSEICDWPGMRCGRKLMRYEPKSSSHRLLRIKRRALLLDPHWIVWGSIAGSVVAAKLMCIPRWPSERGNTISETQTMNESMCALYNQRRAQSLFESKTSAILLIIEVGGSVYDECQQLQ
jgi:hypothetical protein